MGHAKCSRGWAFVRQSTLPVWGTGSRNIWYITILRLDEFMSNRLYIIYVYYNDSKYVCLCVCPPLFLLWVSLSFCQFVCPPVHPFIRQSGTSVRLSKADFSRFYISTDNVFCLVFFSVFMRVKQISDLLKKYDFGWFLCEFITLFLLPGSIS